MEKLGKAIVVLAFSTLAPAANAAVLTGFLESETGPPNDVTWTIGVINAGPAAAMNAKIGWKAATLVRARYWRPAMAPAASSQAGRLAAVR